MTTPKSLRERINDGEFRNKLPYASSKKDPVVCEAYWTEDRRLYYLFKKEALEHVGLENHPKKDLIYSKAWEDGHAYGFSEVLCHLESLSDFIHELES